MAHHVVPHVVPPKDEVQWAFPVHLRNRWHTPCRTAITEVLPTLSTTIHYWYDISLQGYTLRGIVLIESTPDLQTPPSRHVVPPPPLIGDNVGSSYHISGTTRVCHPPSSFFDYLLSSCVMRGTTCRTKIYAPVQKPRRSPCKRRKFRISIAPQSFIYETLLPTFNKLLSTMGLTLERGAGILMESHRRTKQ